jgi:hypothetical protein
MSKEKSKKKPLRNQIKYPSLVRKYNSRIRQEYLDADYLDKLDDSKKNVKLPDGTMVSELEYYALFMKEWNNAGVGKQSEAEKNKLHRTAKDVKDCTDRNNKRNHDQYARAKKDGLVHKVDYETLKEWIEKTQAVNGNLAEESIIEFIDAKKKLIE